MFSKKKAILTILLGALVIVLLNLPRHEPLIRQERTGVLDTLLIILYSPIQRGLVFVDDKIGGFFSHYFYLVDVKKDNERLKQELALKDQYIVSLSERLKLETRHQILGQQFDVLGLEGLSARVIAYDLLTQSQTLILGVGEEEGVRVDQPVIAPEGLVGRVIKTFPHTSQVLLLGDPHFSVDVIDEATRFRALVVGSGRAAVLRRYPIMSHMEFLRLGDEIRTGDLLITSGLSGIYPPGIPVGNVIDVEEDDEGYFSGSAVLPCVDFSKLEAVMVIKGVKEKPAELNGKRQAKGGENP